MGLLGPEFQVVVYHDWAVKQQELERAGHILPVVKSRGQ